jgi:hypothetical protein
VHSNVRVDVLKYVRYNDPMQTLTATALRKNLYNTLDKVAETGVPVKLERKGKKLQIILVDKVDKLANLKTNDIIVGDPDELINLKVSEWNEEKNL